MVLIAKDTVRNWCAEHFEILLSWAGDEEPVNIAVGRARAMNVLRFLNEALMTREEVRESVKMKAGKYAGLERCATEYLKSDGAIVTEWLVLVRR